MTYQSPGIMRSSRMNSSTGPSSETTSSETASVTSSASPGSRVSSASPDSRSISSADSTESWSLRLLSDKIQSFFPWSRPPSPQKGPGWPQVLAEDPEHQLGEADV